MAISVGAAAAADAPPPPAAQQSERTVRAQLTGYTWWDNTPPQSSRLAFPGTGPRDEAGGAGTFEDPLTVAVGHDLSSGVDVTDWPMGTRFYVPLLGRYLRAEDTCGDGPTPERGPCHIPPAGADTHLDVWLDGRDVPVETAQQCASQITRITEVIVNPPAGLPVASGQGVLQAGHCVLPAAPTSTPSAQSTADADPTNSPDTTPSSDASGDGAGSAAAGRAGPITVQRSSKTWTDDAGTSTPLHVWAPPTGGARGLVVYLDGDDQNGVADPDSPYVLGGDSGIVAAASRAGYAVLAPRAPDGNTWWQNGARNADFVRALVQRARHDLNVEQVWWVGYSGGSQLITKWLLPSYQGAPPTGGALLLGGGGAPDQDPAIPAGYPIYWYTGTADDATNSSDGYDAITDARRGALSYYTAGARALMATPDGVGHNTTRQAGILLTSILR